MLIRCRRLAAFGLIVCLLLCFGSAAAAGLHTKVANDTLDVEVRLGYNGYITYGKPIPVRVTVRNHGTDLEGVLAVNTYASTQQYDRYETGIFVPAGGERTVVLAVEPQIQQGKFTAEILQNGKVICAENAAPAGTINPSAMMIGLLSSRSRNLSCMNIRQENDTLNRYEYWETVALTPETMPDDPELLGAFGMIVLDDTDPALLTEKQQKALKNWIREGHILLCGGGTAAPRNLAFLGEMTSLKAEDFTVSDAVHAALESYAGRKDTGRHPEIALASITGADPLVQDTEGNGLIWRIQAGRGRIYALAWEAGDMALNAENLMHVFYQQMLINADADLYNSVLYAQSGFNALYSAGEESPVKVNNTLPVALIAVAAAVLIGLALWIVLNRHGASRWMWAGIPLIALAAAAVITVMSGSSGLNGTVASVTVNMVQRADGTGVYNTSVTAASPKAGVHRYSMDGEKLKVRAPENYYWYEDEENKPQEPGTLRFIRYSGERNESAVNAESPWDITELNAVRTAEESVDIRAEVWMENDGLHGTVTNGTGKALREGAVLCTWGFVRIPALAPGESADFAMIAENAQDPYAPVFTNGKMIRNANGSMYQVVNQLLFGQGEYVYNTRESTLSGMMGAAAEYLAQSGDPKGSSQASAVFLYSAEPESAEDVALRADGKEVGSKAVITLLNVEAEYLTIGKTGVVFHAPGMDRPVRCALDENNLPAGDMETTEHGQNNYYSYYSMLAEKPTFRFTPKDLDRTEVTSLTIGMEQWYLNDTKAFMLNIEENHWEEIGMNVPLETPGKYLDSNGNLYCQFRPAKGESYTDIPMPTLTLEGRVKDAET